MFDAFEIRLADLLANALVGAANLGPVGRAGAVAAPSAGEVGLSVRVAEFAPEPHVGDDRRAEIRDATSIRLRPTLHVAGRVLVRLTATPPNGPQGIEARARLVTMLDRVLLALHPEAMRSGQGFDTGADQGFELDSFRLQSVGPLPEAAEDVLQIDLGYGFAGRFWPVVTHPEGDVITTMPTRIVAMPVRLPERLVAQAGGANLSVPLRLDLSAADGAATAVAARLEGAAPPGALVGDGTPAPAGYTGFAVGADGLSDLVYQPPANLTGRAEVRVETRLAHPDRPSIPLTRFTIEVLAS